MAGQLAAWVVHIDDQGSIQWEKTCGGISLDYANSIIKTSDGGYIFAGLTNRMMGTCPELNRILMREACKAVNRQIIQGKII